MPNCGKLKEMQKSLDFSEHNQKMAKPFNINEQITIKH